MVTLISSYDYVLFTVYDGRVIGRIVIFYFLIYAVDINNNLKI